MSASAAVIDRGLCSPVRQPETPPNGATQHHLERDPLTAPSARARADKHTAPVGGAKPPSSGVHGTPPHRVVDNKRATPTPPRVIGRRAHFLMAWTLWNTLLSSALAVLGDGTSPQSDHQKFMETHLDCAGPSALTPVSVSQARPRRSTPLHSPWRRSTPLISPWPRRSGCITA